MSAGYSKRPLYAKLGIKAGYRIYLHNPPENYGETLGELPETMVFFNCVDELFDLVQVFTKSRSALEKEFAGYRDALKENGMLWISWPKKSAKVETDLTEDVIRGIGLQNGMVDVKVCAVDEIWSGLKFVFRLRDRKGS